MKRLLCLALVASLSACATTSTTLDQRLAKAAPTVERITADYQQASAFAELLLPYLSPARVAQIRAAQAIVVQALQAAHVATSLAEQRAAIDKAEAAQKTLEVVTDAPAPLPSPPS